MLSSISPMSREKVMFNKKFVSNALPHAQVLYSTFPSYAHICIDSRTLKRGDIFVACVGSKQDGHNFVGQAFAQGAAGAIIQNDKHDCLKTVSNDILRKSLVISVQDTCQALYELATAWRMQFTYPVIGITGSVGKTSTREIICNILHAAQRPFVATAGNYNSLLGLAISIFNMRPEHTAAIFEVGISRRGEMMCASDMLKPTSGAIINIGHSHMEGLGSLTDIATEKRDLFKHFKPESIGVINGDQPILANVGYTHPVIRCGAKSTNQIQARKIRINSDHSTFILKLYKNKYAVRVNSCHEGRIFNALTAAGVCWVLGIEAAHIIQGIQEPFTIQKRFELLPLKNHHGSIINDCYNASPESMRAAILAIEHIKTQAYKIAVLGDMLELGVDSSFWHRQIGRSLRKAPSIQEVILVGTLMQAARELVPHHIKTTHVQTTQEALSYLQTIRKNPVLILIKASLGMHFENIVEPLVQRPLSFAGAKRATDDEAFKSDALTKQERTTS